MRLLYVITEDWFFTSHFIDRAIAAKERGFEVFVATRDGDAAIAIRSQGITVLPIDFSRRGMNPVRELMTILKLRSLISDVEPDIVHNIALKPVVLGTIAAILARTTFIVNAPVGMGYIFSSQDRRATLLRPIFKRVIKVVLNPRRSRVIIENPDDYAALVKSRMVQEQDLVLIKGAGVDVGKFHSTSEPAGTVVISLVARMLKDKGVFEFVEAARILKASGVEANFNLVGGIDKGNPSTLTTSELESWSREGIVNWLGQRDDIARVLSESHIVCLPSYREGLPKSLIEALAAGRPVVTTDVPGCREVVRHQENGLLVEPRNATALAEALRTLIANKELRQQYGATGRVRAENEFSNELITSQTFAVYESFKKI